MLFICCLLTFSRNAVETNKQQQQNPLNNSPNKQKRGRMTYNNFYEEASEELLYGVLF